MNCFEQYIVELLQGHITSNNKTVPVVKGFSNAPSLPCITLDLSGGVTTDYIYHDVSQPKEKVYKRCTANININVWCNTEEERESINNQILQCYYDDMNYHYKYCTRYNDGNCTTTTNACPAIAGGVQGKYQCTNMDLYRYQSLREKHSIVDDTVTLDAPFDLDEYNEHPPLLRSVLRAKGDFEQQIRELGKPYKTGSGTPEEINLP